MAARVGEKAFSVPVHCIRASSEGGASREEQKIVSDHEIKAGTTIIEECAMVCILQPKLLATKCSFCWKNATTNPLKRCSKCKVPRYCSRECQIKDWKNNHHSKECSIIGQLMASHPSSEGLFAHPNLMQALLLATRIIVTNQIHKTNSLIHHRPQLSQEFDSFLTEASKLLYSRLPGSLQQKIYGEQEIVDLLCRLQCNVFNILNEELVGIGVGLYINTAKINHSCNPNSACSFDATGDKKLTIRSIRTISKGEDITISYIERMQASSIRRADLSSSFYFSCECTECCDPDRLDKMIEGYKCRDKYCPGVYRVRNHIPQACDVCFTLDPSFAEYQTVVSGITDWKEQITRIDKFGASKFHQDRLEILEVAFHSALGSAQLSTALEVVKMKYDIISGLLPMFWPVLAITQGLIGTLQSELGLLPEAKESFLNALRISAISLPSSHSSVSRWSQEMDNVASQLKE